MCKTRVYVLYNGSVLVDTTLYTSHEQVFFLSVKMDMVDI